jgi:fumarylacetoacetase
VAIGDQLLDLRACQRGGYLEAVDKRVQAACASSSLIELFSLGRWAVAAVRREAMVLLRAESPVEGDIARHLLPQSEVSMMLPCQIGDYTDFYASLHHASNVGSMFRPDNPILPNYKYIPVGYHGRASSIVVSGTPFHRPRGQVRDDPNGPPIFGPSKRLDYEMEVGALICGGNPLGQPIPIDRAEEHVAGLCLVNDWSARDIQTWEYQPLGPFLAKNFATTMSPWIVTLEALEPYRVPPFARPAGDPEPLPYLRGGSGFDITLEVWLKSAKMSEPMRLSHGNFRDMYWTMAQLVTHHASNGCNLRPGDLLASGTVSGETKESRGSLLELTWRGTEPITLPTGETRSFLEDGDEIIMRGWCEKEGLPRIGFGECRGFVLGAF